MMFNSYFENDKIGKLFSTVVILASVLLLYQWKNYENRILNEAVTETV